MKRKKSKRTPKGARLLDSQCPCVLSPISDCHQQARKVKVIKALSKATPTLQKMKVKTRKRKSGRSPRKTNWLFFEAEAWERGQKEDFFVGELKERAEALRAARLLDLGYALIMQS